MWKRLREVKWLKFQQKYESNQTKREGWEN